MDFLNGKSKTLYFKYLAAAFGSALITSIYSIVDMAMVGSTMDRKERQRWRWWHLCGMSFTVWSF